MSETPIAARPKMASESPEHLANQNVSPEPPRRGPGRPPKPETADPFTVLSLIAAALKTVEKPFRRQILETLLSLSE